MRYRVPASLALVVLGLTACSRNRPGDTAAQPEPVYTQPSDPVVAQPTPEVAAPSGAGQIAMGDSVFAGRVGSANCATCHAVDAKGTSQAPDLTDDKWLHGDGGLEFIKQIVRNGVPTPKEHSAAMPGFQGTLTDEQIDAVAAYVRSRSARGAS